MLEKIFYVFILSLFLLVSCDRNRDKFAYGYVEGRFTYISSQVSGTLDTITVSRGDLVEKDQLLFILDPDPEASEVTKAKANLDTAKANLANLEKGKRPSEIKALEAKKSQIIAKLSYAKKTVERYDKLFKKGVLDKSTLDQAISDYDRLKAEFTEIKEDLITAKSKARIDEIEAARAAVDASKAALKKAKWQLNQKKIYAPISGKVFDVYYRTGETIPSNYGVLSLLAPENIYVVFFVPETKLSAIKIDQKVNITCDSCKDSIIATISFVSPKAEFTPPVIYSEKTRVSLIYRIEAELSKEDAYKLNVGQPITIKLS